MDVWVAYPRAVWTLFTRFANSVSEEQNERDMKKHDGKIIYSPSDLIRYLASPYASWMDRYHLENPGVLTPDEDSEDRKLIAKTGDEHEQVVLQELKTETKGLVEIDRKDVADAKTKTLAAIEAKAPIIYQAALESDRFFGFADFIILGGDAYQIWDTKLARSPKPYYAIQLCCYSEMFAAMNGGKMPEKFGIILGSKEKVEFRVEDYLHYYRRIRDSFLAMQDGFTGDLKDCPEPLPSSDPNAHGCWTSHANKFFEDTDHLVKVAGITTGQIKKLKAAGITTAAELAAAGAKSVPSLVPETFKKLVEQAKLQVETRTDRVKNPDAPARYEVLSGRYAQLGLGSLPPENSADVFFDMEGYPLVSGGLEYLFGVCAKDLKSGEYEFHDWWAHDRDEEKVAFEGFVDWVYKRWRENPGMHIYHYAAYEVNAVRRLSTRHDTKQDEVDNLLRAEVFVDLYSVVRHGLRIGEESYSIKKVEHLYRPKRSTEVATAVESIVQYAQWIEGKQPKDWKKSAILKDIRDYNEDDCKSTDELLQWMRKVAAENGIAPSSSSRATLSKSFEPEPLKPEVEARLKVIEKLREKGDPIANTLADLTDFHRREEKPVWWRMFDRAQATAEELRDDTGCIEGIVATGSPWAEKRSQVQAYTFDPLQECKLTAGERKYVKFTHNLDGQMNLKELDLEAGTLQLKISEKSLGENFGGSFPQAGSIIPIEVVDAGGIKGALTEIGEKYLTGVLPAPAKALIERTAPVLKLKDDNESTTDAAIRVASSMSGGCLVIQGPPGTGKTYTAAHVINALVAKGKRVGVASNGHKAIINLLEACGEAERKAGGTLRGIKVGGEKEDNDTLLADNSSFRFVKDAGDAQGEYSGGIVGGTAWLFVRPEWEDQLDYLFIDEAGQVSFANAIAMSRSAKNIVLLGDQMQLEQPVEGTHPGDSGLSGLQYALKDLVASKPDEPAFHAVVPADYGLFLGESRRMHPSVCTFISESIYEGRLTSFADCAQQCIKLPAASNLVGQEHGILFSPVEHDGNVQKSEEEVERVKAIYEELLGRPYTDLKGNVKNLELEDFLFIAPYNAQVRALQGALPKGARVGSVDKFQGLEAPVCILSLCSSYGEYGGRGLAFILDRNRVNVAISRAQCLAVVVADPRIASTGANSLADMKLLNLFCKLVQY